MNINDMVMVRLTDCIIKYVHMLGTNFGRLLADTSKQHFFGAADVVPGRLSLRTLLMEQRQRPLSLFVALSLSCFRTRNIDMHPMFIQLRFLDAGILHDLAAGRPLQRHLLASWNHFFQIFLGDQMLVQNGYLMLSLAQGLSMSSWRERSPSPRWFPMRACELYYMDSLAVVAQEFFRETFHGVTHDVS